mgnify:CR=1 FL=1
MSLLTIAIVGLAMPTAMPNFPVTRQTPIPALWLRPDGKTTIDGQLVQPKILSGTRLVRMNGVTAYDFDGNKGGLLFGDAPALRLTGSMTVSAWIKLRGYVEQGPGAQVLFRGDDRNGLDPYTMAIHGDGSVNFGISDENALGRSVGAEIPLQKWTHILANFDAESGRLEMWMDGELVGMAKTQYRPFAGLDKGFAPGVSIGNVQNDTGPHNQPLNGYLADVRLYRSVLRPEDLNLGTGGWVEPPNKR